MCCDGKSWCRVCNPKPPHRPDTAMMSADIRLIGRIAKRYQKLARECEKAGDELGPIYSAIYREIDESTTGLRELQSAIFDGRV